MPLADPGFLLLMALVMVAALKLPTASCPDCGGHLRMHWPDCPKVKDR